MCNAWNHSSECTCGWGGDRHLGRRSHGNQILDAVIVRSYPWVPPITQASNSYVIPNAACPVCGAPVFFYQSPDGGRVFFDELGPPWPKHPCTNRDSEPNALVVAPELIVPRWQVVGWEPFFISEILKTYKLVLGLKGNYATRLVALYVSKDSHPEIAKISKQSIAFLKEKNDGSFDLSLLVPSGTQITTGAHRKPIEAGGAMVSAIAGRNRRRGNNTFTSLNSSRPKNTRGVERISTGPRVMTSSTASKTKNIARENKSVHSSQETSRSNSQPHVTAIELAMAEAKKKINK